jgi:hypothetical protein
MSLDDLRAQMHALNAQLADAANKADALTVALQNYTPDTTPPAPSTTVRFGRMLHQVDDTYPVATQEQRYGLQVIQGDQWHLPQVRALGQTLKLRYATPVARRAKDQLGDSTCLPPGQILDSWMLRASNGGIIARERDGDQFVDVGNLAYQAAAAAYLADRCKREGWSGIWLDEINADPRWSFQTMPAPYPNAYRYQVAIRGFVNAVAPVLRAAGLQVWINLAGDYDDAWTNGLARETDGHTIEFFIARGSEQTANLANGYFGEALDWVTRREAEGKRGFFNAQTIDPGLVRYALATYLLASKGVGFFGAGVDGYPVAGTVWTPDLDNARKLGAPLGTYSVTGGLYVRQFSGGTVTVNPGTAAAGGLTPMSATFTLK